MTPELEDQFVRRILCNNVEALHWVQVGRLYIHLIDDVIDEDLPAANRLNGARRMCKIGAMAIDLYTHPFFVKHWAALKHAMHNCTHLYAESIEWEKSGVAWQKSFSDWARHSWIDVLLVVAEICGGYENRVEAAKELRAMSYLDHHDEQGEAV